MRGELKETWRWLSGQRQFYFSSSRSIVLPGIMDSKTGVQTLIVS
jgi:hypothetical protein